MGQAQCIEQRLERTFGKRSVSVRCDGSLDGRCFSHAEKVDPASNVAPGTHVRAGEERVPLGHNAGVGGFARR